MDENYDKPKTVRCSGNLNFEPRVSAFEDFMHRTMNVLQGVWSKLNYIRELRDGEGKYKHWGLAQVHGEDATQKAIADTHSALYLQLLSTPLPELFEQLALSADDADCSSRELAEQLYQERRRITPDDLRGGAPEHLKSVLLITDLLSKYSKASLSAQKKDRKEAAESV